MAVSATPTIGAAKAAIVDIIALAVSSAPALLVFIAARIFLLRQPTLPVDSAIREQPLLDCTIYA